MLFEINVEFFTLVRNSEGLMIDRFDLMFKRFVMQLILKMKQSYRALYEAVFVLLPVRCRIRRYSSVPSDWSVQISSAPPAAAALMNCQPLLTTSLCSCEDKSHGSPLTPADKDVFMTIDQPVKSAPVQMLRVVNRATSACVFICMRAVISESLEELNASTTHVPLINFLYWHLAT